MKSSPDSSNISAVISSFGDNVEKCCAESSVTMHMLLF